MNDNAPRKTIEKIHGATSELKGSGLENQAPNTTNCAAEFSLPNQDGLKYLLP